MYIDKITIKGFYCIKDTFILDNLRDKKEIYLLGENGDGKTLTLQAIVTALKWSFINTSTEFADTGKILDLMTKNRKLYKTNPIEIITTSKEKYKPMKSQKKSLDNLFAYGVHRRPLSPNSTIEAEKYGFMSLFRDNSYLKSSIGFLLDLYNEENEAKIKNEPFKKAIDLEKAKEILKDLLDNNIEINVINSKVVEFKERGFVVDFFSLSEGYKSVIAWVIDLIIRLSENQPRVEKLEDFVGVVLVDEINLHLHPKWEYTMISKLRKWLPNIQFIFTTHSPITILGASEDAVFYRLYKENGLTKVSEPMYNQKLNHLMANSIITSPLFDLESARSHSFSYQNGKDLDTSDDFLYTLIHQQIAAKAQELRQKNKKVYFSEEYLNQLIAEAIAKQTA
ncbi:MAG: AAA family ATPase [Thermoflexibacteraceae bacterium]|jgi:predicted ATP-binding protein involved in virulence